MGRQDERVGYAQTHDNGGYPILQYSININPHLTAAVKLKNPNKEITLDFEPVRFSYDPRDKMVVVVNRGTPVTVQLNSPDGVDRFVNAIRCAVWDQMWEVFEKVVKVKDDLTEFCEEFARFRWYFDET